MKNFFAFFFFILLLASCASKEQQAAASKVAAIWDAQNCTVGKSVSANTSEGSKKTITLELQNLKGVKDDYPKQKVTSVSALTFLEHLEKRDYQDYSHIKISIKDEGSSFEKEYQISDILSAREELVVVKAFFEKIKNNEQEKLNVFFNNTFIPDSTITLIKTAFARLDSANGKLDKMTVTGFDFNTLEETKEPVLVVTAEFANAKHYVECEFAVSKKDKKIVYFGINQ